MANKAARKVRLTVLVECVAEKCWKHNKKLRHQIAATNRHKLQIVAVAVAVASLQLQRLFASLS